MEQLLEGTIKQIYRNKTKTDKAYRVFEIGSSNGAIRYSVWDDTLGLDVALGDKVRYAWQQRGSYKTMTYLEKLILNHPKNGVEESAFMGKVISLTTAANLLPMSANGLNVERKIQKVLEVARQFEEYLRENP